MIEILIKEEKKEMKKKNGRKGNEKKMRRGKIG